MKRHDLIRNGKSLWLALVVLCGWTHQPKAYPACLNPKPLGTNQVVLTFTPTFTNAPYAILVRTNGPAGYWMNLATFYRVGQESMTVTQSLGNISGLTLPSLPHWTFIGTRWNDTPDEDFPSVYKELVLRTDPISQPDPYANPMGDGWNNIQKMQSNLNPFSWYPPAPPQLQVKFHPATNDPQRGTALVTWQHLNGPEPVYYLIERADRTLRPIPRPLPYGHQGMGVSNRPSFRPHIPPFRQGQRPKDPFVTGPFRLVARVPARQGLRDYKFIDPDVNTFAQPSYRIMAHYAVPLHATLNKVDTKSIRQTLIKAQVQRTTNGYHLTIRHPIEYGDYLLLVRDENNPQWRASGYFKAGPNRNPVYLDADQCGMMTTGQSPVAMPKVKFAPVVKDPEFAAGWGEDSDGDGLPDIYEVLVTQTEPDNADSGNTGTLDGYKDLAGDGWSTLEKFRRRLNPWKSAEPPATVVLHNPTAAEVFQAVSPHSDLRFKLQLEIRTNTTAAFQSIEHVPGLFWKMISFRTPDRPKPFDLRVSWRFSQELAEDYAHGMRSDLPPNLQTLQDLMNQTKLELFGSFQAGLTNGPPLSPEAVAQLGASIQKAYRAGEMDKGLAMAEMMAVSDNQAQDFYGRVIDQNGQPVVDAEVSLHIQVTQGWRKPAKTKTDAQGLFQFTGIRGESVSVAPEKIGYQIQGHGLGIKGKNGPETSPAHRAIFTMWKLKGPEPMIHREISSRQIIPDGRAYGLDLLHDKIYEGTNAADLFIRIQRPAQVKPRDKYDWSFSMTAAEGGFIEVTNDMYLNEAPATGYQPEYQMDRYATNFVNYSTWHLYRTDRTFFLKSREGQIYGHFQIKELDPDYRGKAFIRIDYYINPNGSRNLEFDPSKQIK